MSLHLIGVDTLGPVNDGYRSLAVRAFAKTISIIVAVTKRVFQEVVYTICEDIRHGQIQRIPEDWER